jgi:Tol biopolymer transport system component
LVLDAAFPVWSPDGRYLLYTTNRAHVLAVYEAASEQMHVLQRDGDGTFDYVGWSDDGTDVVYVSYRRSINTAGIFRLNLAACLAESSDCSPQPLTHEWGFYASPKWRPRAS